MPGEFVVIAQKCTAVSFTYIFHLLKHVICDIIIIDMIIKGSLLVGVNLALESPLCLIGELQDLVCFRATR